MYGTITLDTLKEVAEFLAAFSNTGSTDVFEVIPDSTRGYEIRFNGAK